MKKVAEKQLVDIWNYLSDTKELIGISNAYNDALPAYCTTKAPPVDIPKNHRVYFNEANSEWETRLPQLAAIKSLKVYAYIAGTGEYISSRLIDGSIPDYCTDIAPATEAPAGSVLVFDSAAQAWQAREDHRGEIVYSTQTAAAQYIDALGSYPENTTTKAPAVPFPRWSGTEWETDTDAQRKSVIRANVGQYQQLMSRVARSVCPLNTGRALSVDEQATLDALYDYADQLAAFIQSADLAVEGLEIPQAAAGLLDYPYALNPTYERN